MSLHDDNLKMLTITLQLVTLLNRNLESCQEYFDVFCERFFIARIISNNEIFYIMKIKEVEGIIDTSN